MVNPLLTRIALHVPLFSTVRLSASGALFGLEQWSGHLPCVVLACVCYLAFGPEHMPTLLPVLRVGGRPLHSCFPCHIEPRLGLFYVAGFPLSLCSLFVFVCHVGVILSSVFFFFCFFGFLRVGACFFLGFLLLGGVVFTNHFSP